MPTTVVTPPMNLKKEQRKIKFEYDKTVGILKCRILMILSMHQEDGISFQKCILIVMTEEILLAEIVYRGS
jgi:hypothetical protein